MPTIRGLSHVVLYVNDLEKMVAFYKDVLGLVKYREHGEAEQHFEGRGNRDENQGSAERAQRHRVGDEIPIVLPTDELLAEPRKSQYHPIKTQPKRFQYRIKREDADKDKTRQQKSPDRILAVAHRSLRSRKRSKTRSMSRDAARASWSMSESAMAMAELK